MVGHTPRVSFLISDTGGGHRASALALIAALERELPGVHCEIIDMFVASDVMCYRNAPDVYNSMASRPPVWGFCFSFTAFYPVRKFDEVLQSFMLGRRYRQLLLPTLPLSDSASPEYVDAPDAPPDIFVSVHPLMQGPVLRAISKAQGGKRRIPFATVVTDLDSAHPRWFHKGVDAVFVASHALDRYARSFGLGSEQVKVHGLPIREAFWKGRAPYGTKEHARQQLGLPPHSQLCMVMGGGDGMGKLATIAIAVGASLAAASMPHPSQLVVVCGRNEEAKRALAAHAWPPAVRAHVLGFISDVAAWMAAADVLVTKAGPGTIAEAATMGLPCVLSSYLPGQEWGNVVHAEGHGFARLVRSPATIGAVVTEWLSDPPRLQAMSERALAAGKPDAAVQIAKDLVELIARASADKAGAANGDRSASAAASGSGRQPAAPAGQARKSGIASGLKMW
jgi:1,2-diacylglycerol 3-beta-galactosyltransferase